MLRSGSLRADWALAEVFPPREWETELKRRLMEFNVELRNVGKRYGEHAALADFSLGVRRGEFLTLLGPSGSGKTTILRLVAGFEQPQEGQVLIEGRDTRDLPPYRRNVNTVFQHYALFPHLNVFRNVAFGLEERKVEESEIRRRVRAVLELVDLPGKEERSVTQLSGGEKQRVALARALVLEPAVLLLDEPLGALDQKLRHEMQVELRRLRERLGITFIFVTHDQEEALVMADRIAVINRGGLEQVGTGEEIYERPRTRFVAEFMGVKNFFEVCCAGCSAQGHSFRTAAGLTLWANGSVELAEGAAATLGIRPEALRMSLEPPEPRPANLVEGVVVEAIYEGDSRRWAVDLVGGEHLVARAPNPAGEGHSNGLERGKRVWLTWDPIRTLVYSR
jgi:spermidine/putrescine transport system ATP-binding protein